MDPFKRSPKSICHQCSNINEDCKDTHKSCGTDSKLGVSFVQRCSSFNRPMGELSKKSTAPVAVDAPVDSRVEMMGGGH
jgi:hypothetical protein